MTTETTGTAEATRFLGVQVVVALDEAGTETATVHYEANGTCGVAAPPDRDPRVLVALCAAMLTQAAEGMAESAADADRWPAR